MKRGEIWTIAGGPDFAGKPRPCVILQQDLFDVPSVTVCLFTTTAVDDLPLLRLAIAPTTHNGLVAPSYLMVDKITTVWKRKVQHRVGRLSEADVVRLNRAVLVFLGLAG